MTDAMREYYNWILAQDVEGCALVEDGDDRIRVESDLVRGAVSLYDIDGMQIVELRLERASDGESAFFLHFEYEGLERAQRLFDEMVVAVHRIRHREVQRVLLCCTSGMTTTFFSTRLNELAKSMDVDYSFDAVPIQKAKERGVGYAAVLLAPQVGHMRKELAEALPGTPVIELPASIFGAYDAASALTLVMDLLSGGRAASKDIEIPNSLELDRTKRVLAMSYVHREDEPTLSYRVMDQGRIVLSGTVMRSAFSVETLDDLAATLRVQGWKMSEFDAVGLAIPGVVEDGVLTENQFGEAIRYDLGSLLRRAWGVRVFVDSNPTAAAVGCYVSQSDYDSVAFHAQTVGVPSGEEGYVINGRPVFGHGGRSGHLGPLAANFTLGMDVEDAAWRVSGIQELVARYLSSLACTIAPEAIYVWCDLIPDMDELREELEKTLPPAAVPDLIEVVDYDKYVLLGELALCMGRLSD